MLPYRGNDIRMLVETQSNLLVQQRQSIFPGQILFLRLYRLKIPPSGASEKYNGLHMWTCAGVTFTWVRSSSVTKLNIACQWITSIAVHTYVCNFRTLIRYFFLKTLGEHLFVKTIMWSIKLYLRAYRLRNRFQSSGATIPVWTNPTDLFTI